MPRKSEQEWAIIEDDYIRNPVTFDNLRDRHHISKQAVITRALKNDWHEKRTKYLTRTVLKSQEGNIKDKIDEKESILNQIEKLIKLKTKAELAAFVRYYEITDDGKSLSPMDTMKLINKSKDSITELTKLAELLKGNATDRTDYTGDAKEAGARKSRMELLGINN